MKNLLLNEYPAHFGANGRYDISSVENQGTFPLNDEKACRECRGQNKQQCSEEDADRHMLLHADHPVTVVDIEGFLNQFDGKKAALKDRCDRMLYDDNKIVLVDFYCGQQKFVPPYSNTQGEQPGKLAKARLQINSTVEKICEMPSINEKMDEYASKEGIFACRIKQPTEVTTLPGAVAMQTFLNSIPQVKGYTIIAHGFKFRMLEYPEIYEW